MFFWLKTFQNVGCICLFLTILVPFFIKLCKNFSDFSYKKSINTTESENIYLGKTNGVSFIQPLQLH